MIQASDGNFYGTTAYGQTGHSSGTLFRFTPNGTLTTLHRFDGYDGASPQALVEGLDGYLYGTTSEGGASGLGAIFKITRNGEFTLLYSFSGTDGQQPEAGLIQATDGNFYGTTEYGGTCCGTIFDVTPSGSLTTLHVFNGSDGKASETALVQDTNGSFYGVTVSGGENDNGVLFQLSVGLGSFVRAIPSDGRAGAGVRILGTNLAEATSVTFNGTPADFTVISPSQITTVVPSGSMAGKIQVVTPAGTLSSNLIFRVLE